MAKRIRTTKGYSPKKNPMGLRKEKLNNIGNPALTEHERDLAALERMKELERRNRRKMEAVRIDNRTVIAASSKTRLNELVKEYGRR